MFRLIAVLQEQAVFVACPCELDQMDDHPQTFSSTGKCRHVLQARRYMKGSLPPEDKKDAVGMFVSFRLKKNILNTVEALLPTI